MVLSAVAAAVLLPLGAEAVGTTPIPPRPSGAPVLDRVGILSPAAHRTLVALESRLTSERNGAEVGVLVVDTLNGDNPRAFATDVYNAWGLGDATADNGAIIMVAKDDHAIELVLGDGVDDEAGIAASRAIVSEYLVPAFKRGDFEGGILAGADKTATKILGLISADGSTDESTDSSTADSSVAKADTTNSNLDDTTDAASPIAFETNRTHRGTRLSIDVILQGIFGAVLVGTSGVAALRHRRRHRVRPCPNCAKPMVRLDETADDAKLDPPKQAEERVGSVDYDVWACTACDRALVLRYGKLFTHYKPCPQCGAKTKSATSTAVRSATTTSTGLARIDETCANCSFHHSYTKTIPKDSTTTSDSSFSSGSGSGSSGGGGGHSSGGGSSGSW